MTIFDKPVPPIKINLEEFEQEETLEDLKYALKKAESDLMWLTCPVQGQSKACYEETVPYRKIIKDLKRRIREFK